MLLQEMTSPKIFIGTPSYDGNVSIHFAQALGQAMAMTPNITFRFSEHALVHHARDLLVDEFIKSNCTHLVFIDADTVFSPHHIQKLIGRNRDIVAGFCPQKTANRLESLGLLDLALEPNKPVPDDGLIEMSALGMGLTCISKEVATTLYGLERRRNVWGTPSLFRYESPDGTPVGEDIYFTKRARELGFKLWLDISVETQHIGQVHFSHRHRLLPGSSLNDR